MLERPRRSRTLSEQWRAYGSRRLLSRWTSRSSLLVGVGFGVVLLLAATVLAVRLLQHAWLWVWVRA